MSNITVYYSSATSDLTVKKHQTSLKNLLDSKKEKKYTEVDLAQLQKGPRDEVYAKAGSKAIPLVFVNDKYVGTYEDIQTLEEDEKLDSVL